MTRTQPNGRIVGVDIIPAQPPRGVSTIQGNFLSPAVQQYVLDFVSDPARGRLRDMGSPSSNSSAMEQSSQIPIDRPTRSSDGSDVDTIAKSDRTVDVVLSDMSAPWVQTKGFWNRSLSNPYHRMMNTSGVSFRDHAGSMVRCRSYKDSHFSADTRIKDLCRAALQFSFNVLKSGGHFVCKFYQGSEDKVLEKQLRALFEKVHRLKPESSRSVRNIVSKPSASQVLANYLGRSHERPILLLWLGREMLLSHLCL